VLTIGGLVDRFVIEAELGEGGMGRVYRALDPRLGRRVALKVLVSAGSDGVDEEGEARMMREARAAAAFNHPNVVTIYEVGRAESGPYIAMELVAGRTLRASIGGATTPDAKKLSWLVEVARGLAAAHRAGLVHRDIKPDNVMITADGAVKILDFGIARDAEMASNDVDSRAATAAAPLPSLTAAGQILGTVQYMAPEQLRGEPLDGRCDQFAWGVMAWELFTGRLPWGSAGNPALLVSAVLSVPVRPLHDVLPNLAPKVSSVVARALSKNRDTRFASMDELLAALEGESTSSTTEDVALQATIAISEPVAPRTAPPQLPIREKPTRWGTVVGSVLAVALVAAGGVWWELRPTKRPEAVATAVEAPPANNAVAAQDTASNAADDQLERKVRRALKYALGEEGLSETASAPDASSSAAILALRAAGIRLRVESTASKEGGDLVVLRDSFTDRAVALGQGGTPSERRELGALAIHVGKLNALKTQIMTLSRLAMETSDRVQVGALRDMRTVASIVEGHRQQGLAFREEDWTEVRAVLLRQRRLQALAASTVGMLAGYLVVAGPQGDPRALDDVAHGLVDAVPLAVSASMEDAKSYVDALADPVEQKARYESWLRLSYGDSRYERQFKARIDDIFRRPAPHAGSSGAPDAGATPFPGDAPLRSSLDAISALAQGDAKRATASAIRLAPGGGPVKTGLETAAQRLEL
jgi:serine/threonine-protein kinase